MCAKLHAELTLIGGGPDLVGRGSEEKQLSLFKKIYKVGQYLKSYSKHICGWLVIFKKLNSLTTERCKSGHQGCSGIFATN